MDRITKSLLATFAEQNEISNFPIDKQFEYFCIYTVITKVNRTNFEIDSIHTGNGGDCGLDGVCIIINGKIIDNIDELDEIVDAVGFLDAEIIFIQSKTSSSFSGADIGTLIHGIKDFISESHRLIQNERVKKFKSIWDAILDKSSFMTNHRPKCKVYYISTGKWVDDNNLTAIIDNGKNELLNTNLFEELEFFPLGAVDLQRLYN